MFPGGIGTGEVLLILVLAVVLFGRNLPQVARSLGHSYQQFRKGLSEMQRTINLDDAPIHDRSTTVSRLPAYQERDEDELSVPRFESPPGENGTAE